MAATVSLGCAVALSACTSGYIDESDPCNAKREPFVEAKTDFASWTMGGAAAGVVVGGVAGLLIGGKAQHALIAGAAGGLIGAGAGYLAARQRQASNRAELLKLIDGDAASDRRLVDKLTVLVEDLGNCRIGQMQGIQRRARQGEIDRDEADAQIADVEERILEDDEVISSVLGKAGHRLLTYIHAKTLVTAPSSQSSRPRPTVDVQIEIKPGNYVVTRRAHLRSEPSSSSDPPLEVYEPNREIYVTGRTTNNLWYAVSYESGPAFILASTVRGPLGREPVGELAESDRRLVERKEDSKIRIERHMKMLKRTVGAAGRGVTLPVFGA